MDNSTIADNFSLLAKLMDIHGDNSFRAKSYASASFTIDKLITPLAEMDPAAIAAIRGIGDATAKKIQEQLLTGHLSVLDEYIAKTPPGILQMLSIKGIGPKKIATIWKELEIESLGELLYACNENRLTLYKGFGEKTQQNIKEAIEFYLGNQGSYLYQQVVEFVNTIQTQLESAFPGQPLLQTGQFRRQMETIDLLEWVTSIPADQLLGFFPEDHFSRESVNDTEIMLKSRENLRIGFHLALQDDLYRRLFETSASQEFLEAWQRQFPFMKGHVFDSEEAIFSAAAVPVIPACRRETAAIIQSAATSDLNHVIQPGDIRGIIHTHSQWSDGAHSLEAMAVAAKEKGLAYLVISDHSKSAFYANGLQEERVHAQHQQVDELNLRLQPFRIFKSIESDILNDGSLDYSEAVLKSFDLIIASVHSNLKMPQDKAMARLLKAIENPYTAILGHPTGRLLLSRNGYPVDHRKLIDACAANHVVIELNAHPRRLDIDWRWIDYALEKGVLISIDPDAHAIEGFDDCRYGVLVAQKAGLQPAQNLSSFSLTDFERWLHAQQGKRP